MEKLYLNSRSQNILRSTWRYLQPLRYSWSLMIMLGSLATDSFALSGDTYRYVMYVSAGIDTYSGWRFYG
ncbi:MAG: hypothetical protein DRO15_04450, partial [Thermoprotei archaeon]